MIELVLLHNGRESRFRCHSVAEVELHLEDHWDRAFARQAGQWHELVDARWKRLDTSPNLKDGRYEWK